jgi:hypothetical protein
LESLLFDGEDDLYGLGYGGLGYGGLGYGGLDYYGGLGYGGLGHYFDMAFLSRGLSDLWW